MAGPARWAAAIWPRWFDRNLSIIVSARLAMSAAQATAGVVTALYLAAEGFSAVEIAALVACVTAASAVMTSAVGLLSDRLGRKPFLVCMPLLTAGAAATYAVVSQPVVLFVCAALGCFGRGAGAGGGGNIGAYQPAEAAFVAEAVPGTLRSSAFGRLAFFSALGALIGNPLSGLARTHPHLSPAGAVAVYRPAFLAIAALAAFAGLVALGLSDHRSPAGEAASRRMRWPRRSWAVLWRLWITNGVNGVAVGMTGPFMSYWFARRYGASPGEIGVLFGIINIGALGATLSAARVGRRFGTVKAIVAVRMVSGLLLTPMALAPGFWVAGGIYFVRGLALRVGLPLRQTFVQDVADPSERASLTALSRVPAQASQIGSQELAGYLFDDISLAAPFEVAAVFQCAGALVFGAFFSSAAEPAPTSGEVPVVTGRDPCRREDVGALSLPAADLRRPPVR